MTVIYIILLKTSSSHKCCICHILQPINILQYLLCRPDDVCSHHLPISSMSLSASRSVQLLETEPSLSPVLDYGTVCHQILSHVTLCHGSGANLKTFLFRQFYPSILIWFFPHGPCSFYLGHVKFFYVM